MNLKKRRLLDKYLKILTLVFLCWSAPALVSGQGAYFSGVKHKGLGPGESDYTAIGRLIEVKIMPFSPGEKFFESWATCTADSTIWMGGPNIYSTIGPLLAFTEAGDISVGFVDARQEEIEGIDLHVAGPGLYHLEIEWIGKSQCEACIGFLVAKGDTLGRFVR